MNVESQNSGTEKVFIIRQQPVTCFHCNQNKLPRQLCHGHRLVTARLTRHSIMDEFLEAVFSVM
jgi:hypothetical protein